MSDVPQTLIDKITAKLQAEAVETGQGQVFDLPTEITVCIPAYNSDTLRLSMRSVTIGHQSVPVKLIVGENGSDDGTQLFVRGLVRDPSTRNYWLQHFRAVDIVETPQNEEYPAGGRARHRANMKTLFQSFSRAVKTDYAFLLDSDVDVPAGGLRTCLEVIKADPEIGMVGFDYDPKAGHMQGGCTMLPADLFRSWSSRLRMVPGANGGYPCMCSQFNEMARVDKRKIVPLRPISARHRRLEV